MKKNAPYCLLAMLVLTAPLSAGSLSGKVTATGMRSNADAVVYIDTIPGKSFPAPTEHAEMDQIQMVFTPRVLPVLVGTTVDFNNSDTVAHNVFTVDDCADMFDLGNWSGGEPPRSHTFDRACGAVILCNVHPEMEGYVVAVPTPYFAPTELDGSYMIDDLPDGTYTVKVWHAEKKEVSQSITVQGPTSADFTLKK